jgi:hypothetical protein
MQPYSTSAARRSHAEVDLTAPERMLSPRSGSKYAGVRKDGT